MAKRRLIQAINDTLFEEFRRDSSVILFGEDVERLAFLATRGVCHKNLDPQEFEIRLFQKP